MLVTFSSKATKATKPGATDTRKGDAIDGSKKVSKPSGGKRRHVEAAKTKPVVEDNSIRIIDHPQDFHKFRGTKRSKNGCLTCKIRKKKCNEARPLCSDCLRLGKECVWVDYDAMSEEEVVELKERVEQEERILKLRRRKSKMHVGAANPLDSSESSPPPYEHLALKSEDSATMAPPFEVQSDTHEIKPPTLAGLFKVFRGTPSPKGLLQFDTPESSTISNLMNPLATPGVRDRDAVELHQLEPFDYFGSGEKSTFSPAAFINLLKDMSQGQHLHDEQHNISSLDEFSIPEKYRSKDEIALQSPNFSIPTLLEQISLDKSMSPSHFNNFASTVASIFTPIPHSPPSFIPELSGKRSYMYNYYVETLSRKISIAPTSQDGSNSYQNIFLPLAHRDKGVLYGILAWSGFHLGGDWIQEGKKYADLALEHMNSSMTKSPSKNNDDRQAILVKLATFLILCGAEICRGDVKNWSIYLYWGWKILYNNGGILNFNLTKEEHWLISNFAYHDLLASSSCERGTYFSSSDYEIIFSDREGISRGNLSPLLGVSKMLYRIIGDISTLAFESKIILKKYFNRTSSDPLNDLGIVESPLVGTPRDINDNDSTVSSHTKINRLLSSVIDKAKTLESEIANTKPELNDLVDLTDQELECQLTLFEAFQISAKLFLRQSIMKCNPSALESQVLANDLIRCVDILLDSPVQASLVFPMFISGIHCVTEYDRSIMRQRLEQFMNLYGPWNVARAKFLMERVWEQNPSGDQVVDWHSILKDLGWDINFA